MKYSKGNQDEELKQYLLDYVRDYEPYIEVTDYSVFKSLIKAIRPSALSVERRFIYQDPDIPQKSRELLKRSDMWAKCVVASFVVFIPWTLGRYVASYVMHRTFSLNGLNFFNKWVLMSAASISLPLFPITRYIGEHVPCLSVNEALTCDLHNEFLSEYRKRLLGARPDLMGEKYLNSDLHKYDGVVLPKKKKNTGKKAPAKKTS